MCRLVETIKIDNGSIRDLAYHAARAEKSRRELFSTGQPLDIEGALSRQIIPPQGIYKCRVLYREKIEEIQILPYARRNIQSLRVVEAENIDYVHKYEDKSAFESLLAKKGSCDDILIAKHGYLTDTSFSNIALFDGTHWVTPSTYLLRGTQREKLLCQGIIHEVTIRVDDLSRFQKASLINTMLELGETVVAVENIIRQ